jgi:hypothetical protein
MSYVIGDICPVHRWRNLDYQEFFSDAEEREAKGQTQKQCSFCQRYRWQHELKQCDLQGKPTPKGGSIATLKEMQKDGLYVRRLLILTGLHRKNKEKQ